MGESTIGPPDAIVCEFWPENKLLPVALVLRLGGFLSEESTAGEQLNHPTPLIHAQGRQFVCCWFSRAIDFGDESGNPAFWMLEKTAKDEWSLHLRRVSGTVATYTFKGKKSSSFPIKLKRGAVKKILDLEWPKTITVDQH